MNIAFHTAVSGMRSFQQELDITANNIANVDTAGFKGMVPSFSELMYTNMNSKVEGEPQVGHGTKIGNIDRVITQGLLNETGRALDFAVYGGGYFALDNGGNTPVFTRDGTFGVRKAADDNYYLMSRDGSYVLSATQQHIKIDMFSNTNTPNLVGITDRIGMYKFGNPNGLRPIGDNQMVESENSGGWRIVPNSGANKIVNGFLEGSNVELGSEMVDIIQAQRSFQLTSRVVQTADQIEEMINNLR